MSQRIQPHTRMKLSNSCFQVCGNVKYKEEMMKINAETLLGPKRNACYARYLGKENKYAGKFFRAKLVGAGTEERITVNFVEDRNTTTQETDIDDAWAEF